jgi:hypothetical protein
VSAVQFLGRFKKFISFRFAELDHRSGPSIVVPSLCKVDNRKFHRKPIQNLTLQYDDRVYVRAYLRYLEIFETLWNCPELREYIVFPLGWFKDKEGIVRSVIFPKLDASWFLGVPTENGDRQVYVDLLKRVLNLVHGSQVQLVHLDLLPCNIAWRKTEEGMMIRLFDWDTAVPFGPIPDYLLSLKSNFPLHLRWSSTIASVNHDLFYCHIYEFADSTYFKCASIVEPFAAKTVLEAFTKMSKGYVESLAYLERL